MGITSANYNGKLNQDFQVKVVGFAGKVLRGMDRMVKIEQNGLKHTVPESTLSCQHLEFEEMCFQLPTEKNWGACMDDCYIRHTRPRLEGASLDSDYFYESTRKFFDIEIYYKPGEARPDTISKRQKESAKKYNVKYFRHERLTRVDGRFRDTNTIPLKIRHSEIPPTMI